MEHTEEELESLSQVKRPTFLTVLCVLTFIGSGLGLFNGIIGIINFDQSIEQLYQLGDMNLGFDVEEMIAAMEQYGMIAQILNLVCCVGAIYAAILMWKQQKQGFYIYIPCAIAPTLFSLIFMGSMGMSGTLYIISLAFGVGIPLAFILMYAANLKAMR